jgi:hypothetical protein
MPSGQSLSTPFGPYYDIRSQPIGYGIPPVWSDRLAMLRTEAGDAALAFRREMFADGGGYAAVPVNDNVVTANTNAPPAGSFFDRGFAIGALVGAGLYVARRLLRGGV